MATNSAAVPVSSESSSEDDGSSDDYKSDSSQDDPSDDPRISQRRKSVFSQEERLEMFSIMKSQVIGGVPFENLSKNSQKKLVYLKLKQKHQQKRKQDVPRNSNSVNRIARRIEKEQQNMKLQEALLNGQKIAIDCSMGDMMSPKEICKLGRQINRSYSSVRASENPFHLYFTGLVKNSPIHKELHRQCSGFDNYLIDRSESLHHEVFPHDTIVYLTPDSPNVLEYLDNSKVYVIGGLVDESQETDYTYGNAQKSMISTARLPIDVYMDKTNPSVHCALPINHVIDILLDIHSGKNWGTVLEKHVPRRKGYVLKQQQSDTVD